MHLKVYVFMMYPILHVHNFLYHQTTGIFFITISELVKIERPEDYEKDSWTLTDNEKLQKIPALKEQGNKYFSEKKYTEAAEKYFEALGFLEQLVLK